MKILDFGLARAEADNDQDNSALTASGTIVGTPAYMSPEQAGGQDMGLNHLKGCKRLKVIQVHKTAVTAAGVAVLRKELPDCDVQWNGQ